LIVAVDLQTTSNCMLQPTQGLHCCTVVAVLISDFLVILCEPSPSLFAVAPFPSVADTASDETIAQTYATDDSVENACVLERRQVCALLLLRNPAISRPRSRSQSVETQPGQSRPGVLCLDCSWSSFRSAAWPGWFPHAMSDLCPPVVA
jgi:hypothetical protein